MRDEDFVEDITEATEANNFASVEQEDEEEDGYCFTRSNSFNLSNRLKSRLKKEKAEKEDLVELSDLFNNEIRKLPLLDMDGIKSELNSMRIDIPRETFDFSEMQMLYSMVISYRDRVNDIFNDVNDYYQLLITATSELKSFAKGLATGHAPDKEAYAADKVRDFVKQLTIIKMMIDRLNGKMKFLDSAHYALKYLLDHQRALAQINPSYNQYGAGVQYSKMGQSTNEDTSARKLYKGNS